MTKSRHTPPTPNAPAAVAPAVAKILLGRLVENGRLMLKDRIVQKERFAVWTNLTRDNIKTAFGSDSDYIDSFSHAGGVMVLHSGADLDALRRNELIAKIRVLESLIEAIDFGSDVIGDTDGTVSQNKVVSNEVFIVHGHDESMKTAVARCLEKLALVPVILHEQPNAGQTIIEKLETHALRVSFAVVLLTPDDLGAVKINSDMQRPRARQNVVLEMGYFIAKLGRSRVCSLYTPGVELPSDLFGVTYTEIDSSGAWQFKLGRELSAAGFEVDLNLLM